MNTSQFMDKQIMNLSTQSHTDFIDLMNSQEEEEEEDSQISGGDNKQEILPSYDFQPIRPVGASSSPSKFDSNFVGGLRASNSADNKASHPIRNYTSHVSFEPAKVISEKDRNTVDTNLVSEIDLTMKKYTDNILHALDDVSARLSQLESRTRHLENSVDDLSVSVGNNHENADGTIRQLERILKEVHNGVHDIKDKQEIMDAHLQLAKLQVSKVEQHADTQSLEPLESLQSAYSAAQQSQQQLLSSVVQPPPPALIPPDAPPAPPSQQNVYFSQNQIPSLLQREQYLPPPGQAPENLGQPFQVFPQQLQAPAPSSPPQHYPPPQSHYFQPPASTQQSILSNVNLPQQPPTLGRHSEESPYMQSQSYPPNIHQPPSHPSSSAPPPPQYYRPPPPNMYEPPSNRPSPGFSGAYGPSPAPGESYPYNNSSQYKNSSSMKPHHGGGGAYPQLPTARPLPHALPTASEVGSVGSGSASSGNKVPINDVIDKVTNMGFPRDVVRATVRKLTDNGQAVDLNVVLDKLMNDGDGQTHAWFNR